ncbi:MAG TPA: molybdopterin-binding protein, partial [Phycisphaerae bacterium]|nr:molybdopterin-binding protein [Phycisphaerae bacterium]
MRAVVLSIGRELVSGLRPEAHAAAVARALGALGLSVLRHETLDDDVRAVAAALRRAAEEADVVLATGGLGPTLDDMTREALAEAMGVPLQEHPAAEAHLEAWAGARGKTLSESNRRQAMLPRGAEVLANPIGTAVGIAARVGRARVFCLPGVPAEMHRMLAEEVVPAIRRLAAGETAGRAEPGSVVRTIRTFGLAESVVGERLADLMAPDRRPRIGTAVGEGIIDVHIYAFGAPEAVEADAAEVRRRLGDAVFGEGDERLEDA